jgi:hypothetical protein
MSLGLEVDNPWLAVDQQPGASAMTYKMQGWSKLFRLEVPSMSEIRRKLTGTDQ